MVLIWRVYWKNSQLSIDWKSVHYRYWLWWGKKKERHNQLVALEIKGRIEIKGERIEIEGERIEIEGRWA